MTPALGRCRVVLHRPQFPRNVGMVARAMACFDVHQLIVIGPRLDLRSIEAREGAVFAQSILIEARFFSSVEEYHSEMGSGFEVYLSGKLGQTTQEQDLGEQARDWIFEGHPLALNPTLPLSLHLGPEASGFERRDLDRAHCVVRLPSAGGEASFNLSHAAVLALGLLHHHQIFGLVDANSTHRNPAQSRISAAPVWPGALVSTRLLHDWLSSLGFNLASARTSVLWTVQRFLMSRQGNETEIRTFEKVLQQTLRLLKESSTKPNESVRPGLHHEAP